MEPLFGDDVLARPAVALPDGAHHVPGFLTLEQQRWIVAPVSYTHLRAHET